MSNNYLPKLFSISSTDEVWDPDTWEGSTKIVTQLHLQWQHVPEDTPTQPYEDPACYVTRQETTPFERFSTISACMPSASEETGWGVKTVYTVKQRPTKVLNSRRWQAVQGYFIMRNFTKAPDLKTETRPEVLIKGN